MYGLFLRALQSYVCVTFGAEPLARAMAAAGAPPEGFEPLLRYERQTLRNVLHQVSTQLGRPEEGILEDLGTFIITDAGYSATRRLLRFGGANFAEFLYSLEELPDRVRLALPDEDVPILHLTDLGEGQYQLVCETGCAELGVVLLGMLRAMADDYGALVTIEAEPGMEGAMILSIRLLDPRFAEGRRFELSTTG
ncbi:heme NO-binding domain-containing protein [Xinfangfangia pollutisoli]|uniref:heme NO-binding domain-containing protein n=1 Tax=Xinfangfangia pollutisoli TaxID=2865960 RepID=UPI001CD399BE|nr:heme NO-binding domain-containing protein [Xinfangfangia pollutisoli]